MRYKLDNIDKKPPFEVPERYFEDLPMKIQRRVEDHKKQGAFFNWPIWAVASAACVLLIVVLFTLQNSSQSPENMLTEIPTSELVAYLDQLDIDLDDLTSTLPDEIDIIESEDTDMLDEVEFEDPSSLDDFLKEYDLTIELDT